VSKVLLADIMRDSQRVTTTEAMDVKCAADVTLPDLLRIGEQLDATEGAPALTAFIST
jgi:hypothetical protein